MIVRENFVSGVLMYWRDEGLENGDILFVFVNLS